MLDFRMLGPLAVARDGVEIVLGGPRQRAVLAYLLINAGSVIPAERLVDVIWGEAAPTTGTGPLRTYVSQLRRILTSGAGADDSPLVRRPPGYVLDVEDDRVDATRFERRFAEARAAAASGAAERALAALDDALALWRGPALGDLAHAPALRGEATRLDQLGLSARELRAELLLATGQHIHATSELGAMVEAHPLREHLWELLMTALYRAGRQSDALRCYQRARTRLVDEVGIEPGAGLRELEQAILRQDPALDWRPPPAPPAPSAPAAGVPAAPPEGAGDPATPVRHNLPRQLTSFVGRVTERAMVADALAEARLVTLCGPGGCGKTRLALAVAGDLLERFPDGVWFVDLAAVTDPALVAKAAATALGVATDAADQAGEVCGRIGGGEALLVLDNCEHLVDAVAEVVDRVLSGCPAARVLATSREELPVGLGVVRRVGALALPGPAAGHDPAEMRRSEAVQLFLERGRSALGGFAPEGAALDTVAQICRRLDGIPLAIELAAALVGYLPLREIADRLDDRFRLLAARRRDTPARQRTLLDTVDWSFELLAPPERDLFVRLGVFVGDFTLPAAEAVAGVEGEPLAVVHGLGRLVRASMVSCVTGRDGADRYRLLETMRRYALDRLERLDEADEVHRRHARHYAAFAAEAERHVHGAEASAWLARVVAELPNLRAAMAWAFSHDDLDTGLWLADSLRWFFARMGLLDEAVRWPGLLLGRPDLPDDQRLTALTAAAAVAFMRGEFSRTRDLGEQSIAMARQRDDPHRLAVAVMIRGAAAVYEGELERAEECFTEAERLCVELGDRWGRAWMLAIWSVGSRRAGRLDRSRRQAEEALTIFRELRDEHGQIVPLIDLALLAEEEGRAGDALASAREAVRLARVLDDQQLQHTSMCVLGRIEQAMGHHAEARELLVRSLQDFRSGHHQVTVALALEGLAGLAAGLGRHGEAAALLGYTAALRDRLQMPASRHRDDERAAWLHGAEAALGADRVRIELDRGAALDLDRAVGLASTATADPAGGADLVAAGGPAGSPGL